ncbi:MAG: class I SAM-dependent methyltransferase [Planctomycetes bacterium]|nr:class I SAM-dependent methyltransferase [Planctomycetota bacterium]
MVGPAQDDTATTPLAYAHARAAHTHDYLKDGVLAALRGEHGVRDVLDAGCGNGAFAGVLRREGFDVWACDASPSGVEVAREHVPDVRFAVASVYDDLLAPFGRTTPFDAITSLEVIEHLYSPRAFLDRVHGALRPGGLLVLSTPYHGYLKNLALALSNRLDAHFSVLWDGGHIKFWSRRTLSAVLEERGFEPCGFRGAGRLPYLWKSMVLTARRRP